MRKPQADQVLVNSMFQAVEASDVNASVTLGVLVEDYDFDRAHRSINLPDQEGQNVNAVDPLDLYLHSVYHNGRESLGVLLGAGCDHRAVSTLSGAQNLVVLQKSSSLRSPVIIDQGNDVCWAVLSDHPDALGNLEKAYAEHGLQMDVNAREAIPYSVIGLRNRDAQKHTPLDLAVMLYVAQKQSDLKNSDALKIRGEALGQALKPIVERFQQAGFGVDAIQYLPTARGVEKFKPHAPDTEKNIRLLLSHGARGSLASYFPASDVSLADPFTNGDAFEVMSLREFCQQNSSLFPADVLGALTSNSAPGHERHL